MEGDSCGETPIKTCEGASTSKEENASPRKDEENENDRTKWKFLEHKGPFFPPPYEPLPPDVKFYYNGEEMKLSQEAEEVATFYARMNHKCTKKKTFKDNFFHDWREKMNDSEKAKILDLSKCDFKEMRDHFNQKREERRTLTSEQKLEIKNKNEEIQKEYGFCTIDGHKEKIENFKIEPPGLFIGRGEHPKTGKLKRRLEPEDIIINCSEDSNEPKPPPGHEWKNVRHDRKVIWLASWTENIQGQVKYVKLHPSSKLRGEMDWQKYETARELAQSIDKIRVKYRKDWESTEMHIKQRAVALYFIDKLALRAGNEKDEDQADTVGCCSLRVEHISLHEQKDGKKYVVVFDFLGKDCIRYYKEVPVEKRVFENLQLFMEKKDQGDQLFDCLSTTAMNKHLSELMQGLTAKVFRTYNASRTLQQQLDELTNPDDTEEQKILSYNRANREVAILCNHRHSVKKEGTDEEENKEISLDSSKLNYLDPRITVAWCKKNNVPIEKIYTTQAQRDKFKWAIDTVGPDYVF